VECQPRYTAFVSPERSHSHAILHTFRDTVVVTVTYYAPAQGALGDDAVWRLSVWRLTFVWRLSRYIRSAGGVCGRPAGWRVLSDRARLGRPGWRLPLRASVAGLGWGISWRLPAYSLLPLPRRLCFHVRLFVFLLSGLRKNQSTDFFEIRKKTLDVAGNQSVNNQTFIHLSRSRRWCFVAKFG